MWLCSAKCLVGESIAVNLVLAAVVLVVAVHAYQADDQSTDRPTLELFAQGK
jgi:hypothetical protein